MQNRNYARPAPAAARRALSGAGADGETKLDGNGILI